MLQTCNYIWAFITTASTQSGMHNPEVFMSYYQPNYFQFISESKSIPSPSPSCSGSSCSTSVNCNKHSNWTSLECKCVIDAYRNSHGLLRSTKSSQGKRKVWEAIFLRFRNFARMLIRTKSFQTLYETTKVS